MATRIKRYEDRLEHMPDLLARIEREMGPDAQIERRLFRRGALLGFIGGKQMVEVVATVEVSDDLLMGPPPRRRASASVSGNGGDGAPVNADAPKTRADEPAPKPSTAGRTPPRIVPSPSELAASQPSLTDRIPSQRRQVDMRADEQPRVSMASSGLELEPASAPVPAAKPADKPAPAKQPTRTTPPWEASSGTQAKPAKPATTAPEHAALNQAVPPTGTPASPVESATSSESAPAQFHNDITELRDTISELKETVKLLVQAQARTQREEAAPDASIEPLAKPQPELPPEEQLAQAAQQAQADEAQLLLDMHSDEAEADGATGCDDSLERTAAPAARVVADPFALDPSATLPAVQRQAYERLLDWNIGPYDALELINTAITGQSAPEALSSADILKVITNNICRNMLLSGGIKPGKTPPGKVVALVGATGVGKTTTIAKLAAKFAFQEGQRVSLVSLDNYRIAAAEQLRTYSEIMGIDLDIVFSKDEFDTQLTARRHCDLVLIDTAGRSPINTKQIYELREVFTAHPPDEVHLVVSASTKGDDLRAILENFAPLGYDHIIVSKLDETRSLGTIYNISKLCKHPISYVTVGQRVPEDIRTATLQFIQQWIEQGRAV